MEQLPANDHAWNRKLIQTLWWVLIGYELATIFAFSMEHHERSSHSFSRFIEFQAMPTSLLLILMGIGYAGIHYFAAYGNFIMIVWTSAMACIFIVCIPELMSEYELLCVPIILSSIYFQRKFIVFSYSLGLFCFLGLTVITLYRGYVVTPYQFIVPIAVITATAFICKMIMNKGLDLSNQLKVSIVREQDLLIRNVMTDRLSKVDSLTELFNHRSFQEHTDHLISHMPSDTPLELALMDIDNFKQINDTYGHWVGDVVLKTVGSLLREVLGTDDMAFRYGGEEFAVLFVGKTHEEVTALCEHVMSTVRSTVIPEMPDQQLTMSIGLAPYNRNTMKKAWFQLVDECLYMAKRSGKNQIHSHLSK